MDEPVEIVELTGLGALAPVLAAWHHREWGHLYDPGVWDLVSGLVDLADLDVSGLGDLVPEDAFEALVEGFEGLGDALGHLAGAVGDILPTDGCGDGCGEGCLDF